MFRSSFFACCVLLSSSLAMGFEWGATHFTYLKGDGYAQANSLIPEAGYLVEKDAKTDRGEILSLEHVNGTKWGDSFFFVDATNFSTERQELYLEVNPRLSSKKNLGLEFGGFIEDVLLTAQYNSSGVASMASPVYLYGFSADLKIPKFNYFQTHFYLRDDRGLEGTSYQVTLVWAANFDLGMKLEFGGFLDYAGAEGNKSKELMKAANLLAQPYLALNINDSIALGIEYQYWQNKYGIKNLNESLPQLMLRLKL